MRQRFQTQEEPTSRYSVPRAVAATGTVHEVVAVATAPKATTRQQRSKAKAKTLAFPRMRYVVLALVGLFGFPWMAAKPSAPLAQVPARSANLLFSRAAKRLNSSRAPFLIFIRNHQKRLSQYSPTDWQARQQYLFPIGQKFPPGLEDPSCFQTIEEARKDREKFKGELETFQKALALPFYDGQYEPLSGEFVGARELARLRVRDGNLKQLDGDFKGALDAYLDVYALGMKLNHAKSFDSAMIGVLCEGIALAPAERVILQLTAEQARASATRLEGLMAQRVGLESAVAHETAAMKEQLRFYAKPEAQEQLWGRIPAVQIVNDLMLQRYQEAMEQQRSVVQQPYQQAARLTDPPWTPYDLAMGLADNYALNAKRGLTSSTWRLTTARRLLLRLALRAWQLEHAGTSPKSLAELTAAGYLKAIPTDPFSQSGTAAFPYDPQSGKVWTVGWNGLDEHGAGDDPATSLFGP